MVIVAGAVGLALLIQALAIKPYQIPSGSMEPTLAIDQRVLVNRIKYRFVDPDVGDIVVFHPPKGADNGRQCGVEREPRQPCPEPTPQSSDLNFIKRIVAGPGDTVAVVAGQPVVNGVEAEEDFITPCRGSGGGCDLPEGIEVPPDHYFMMGDNRGASDDSRFWGPVSRDEIIGQAFVTYWPPSRVGLL